MRLLFLILPLLVSQTQDQLKPPPSKLEEQKTFHAKQYRGTTAAERAQAYDKRLELLRQSRFSQLKWRSVGPENQSGRVIDVESPADHPEQLLVAFATGGLWRTEDDGITWTPLFENQSAFGIGNIAVSRDGKTIWLGSGESNSQRTVYSGTGAFKSTDAGATWTHMGLPESQHIGKVLIDPRKPDTVYVAAMGHLYSANPERGVFKTEDGGKTWSHVLKVDERTGAIDLAMNPKNPDILLASMWDNDRRAWNFKESGPGSAVYRSENGGKSWSKVTGLPSGEFVGRTGLAFAPSDPKVAYALVDFQGGDPDTKFKNEFAPSGTLTPMRFILLTEDEFVGLDKDVLEKFGDAYLPRGTKVEEIVAEIKDKKKTLADVRTLMERRAPNVFAMDSVYVELWRTDDAGKTWRKTHRGGIEIDYGYYFGKISVNPRDANDLVALGLSAYRSRDGGKTFSVIANRNHSDHHAMYWDAQNPKRMVNGNDGGPYLSEDGGKSWRHLNNLAVGQTTTLALDNKRPYNIITGLQDNGTMLGPSTYRPGFSDLSAWKDINGGDGSAIAVDPRGDGDLIYSSSQFGSFNAWDQKTNERWNVSPPRTKRHNWIAPIIVSPHHPDIIYVGSEKLSRSLDRGRTWEDLSGDLTKNLPNGDVPFSTLKDISESPFKFGQVVIGCDDGTVKVTQDHGGTWTDISTPAPDKWVSRVVASKYDRARIYVAQNGYREDDFKAYLWRSDDLGKTWKSIVGNLPDEPINVIREDPEHKETLYVGTDMGVYVSFDAGNTWEALAGGLSNLPVHDLQIQQRERDLVIATHARSCWVLSLKPFDDITDEVTKPDIYLWTVDDMTRGARWGFDRRQAWSGDPDRKQLLNGRFFAKAGGKGTVSLKEKATGKVVKEVAIEAVPGFNFFSVDLELTPSKPNTIDVKKWDPKTAADKLKDPYEAERPTYIAAGEYTLEIKIGDKIATQVWKLNAP